MNPLYSTTRQGTIGELLVQLRLLELEVQAMQPHKDSGNDLIAIRGRTVKSLQVKTTTKNRIRKQFPNRGKIYDVLALVRLVVDDTTCKLDQSEIFLLKREDLETNSVSWNNLSNYRLSLTKVEDIWPTSANTAL